MSRYTDFFKTILFITGLSLLGQAQANPQPQEDATAFKAYQKQQQAEFKTYITNLNQAFTLFKQTYQAAFKAYKNKIQAQWQTTEVSTAKKWVSYTHNFQQKTVVNYKTGQITISNRMQPNQSKAQALQLAKKRLQALKQLTYQQAYAEDPVASKVDKILTQQISPRLIKTTPPSRQRMAIISHTPKPQDLVLGEYSTPKGPVVTVSYRLKPQDINQQIKAILPQVMQAARKEHIPPALILAIVKNESAFNPLARSHIPAYGLMQIVPRSAGIDATRYLFGQPKLLTSAYLYTPNNNLSIGTAYLHILNYRYLKQIRNPKTRLYCTIAAYNTGAGNVAKAFTGNYSIKNAAKIINQKTPQAVYQHLQRHLPYQQTKHYLTRVSTSYQHYQPLFNKKP